MPDSVRLALRLVGLAVGILLGLQFGALLASTAEQTTTSAVLLMVLSIGGLGYLLGPRVVRRGFVSLRGAIREASPVDLLAIATGLLVGGAIAALLAYPLSLLPHPAGQITPFIVALSTISLMVGVAIARKRDLIQPWYRPPQDDDGQVQTDEIVSQQTGVLLDTSVIIDGRVADVARTGFLDARLLVPQFVLEELQKLADSSDPMRRQRGRRGLDTLNRLQVEQPQPVEVLVTEQDDDGPKDVDGLLVKVAQEQGLRILTNDYNLNRVAQIQGVTVLNLNELTGALRPPVLPGEDLQIKVVQEGREPGQGVGFLDDGTMVVVDSGRELIGDDTVVTVTRLLQTGAGRMVFAMPKGLVPNGTGTGELRSGRGHRQTGNLSRRRTDELQPPPITVAPRSSEDVREPGNVG